ncbi:MAG: hypothetical protein Q8881_03065 [Sweet potato little leaf phytoplasma]|nr:hypothetical protein [Sweet potato little leaf phytoplasma]
MGCFERNRLSNPTEFRTRDDFDETTEFSPNFALGDISPETAESLPPNFSRISHSGHFRRNGRINLAEFPPNFTLEDIFDETAEFPSNFAIRDVFAETTEHPPNFALGEV